VQELPETEVETTAAEELKTAPLVIVDERGRVNAVAIAAPAPNAVGLEIG
jgi:hypothetical protein